MVVPIKIKAPAQIAFDTKLLRMESRFFRSHCMQPV